MAMIGVRSLEVLPSAGGGIAVVTAGGVTAADVVIGVALASGLSLSPRFALGLLLAATLGLAPAVSAGLAVAG